MTFKREQRYTIFKFRDILGLSAEERTQLRYLVNRINELRSYREAPPFKCVVVEQDWPEYETVWKMIEDRVNGNGGGTT